MFRRIIWIVLDSVGIGAMPDAAAYRRPARTATLWATSRASAGSTLPNLARLGLGNIKPLAGHRRRQRFAGGLWPLHAGLARQRHHHRTLGNGRHPSGEALSALSRTDFPPEIMREFETRIGRRSLGNKAASGTEIIKELGAEHMRTGSPDCLHLGRQRFSGGGARRSDPAVGTLQDLRDRAGDSARTL